MSMLNLTSSFSSRRSHLSSATYQTLVSIFSLCPDDVESLKPSQQQNPNPSPRLDSDANGNSQSERAAFTDDSLRLPVGDTALELGDRKRNEDDTPCAHGRMEKGEGFINFDIETELEFGDEGNDDELLQCIITDCAKLIEGSADGSNLLSNDQNGSFGLEKARERTCQEMEIVANVSDSIDELKCEQPTRVDNVRELGEGTQQEACIISEPFVSEEFRDRNLEDGEVDGKDFEEGEIQNDFDSSNQSLDLVHEKLDEASLGFDKNGNSILTDGCCVNNEIYSRNGLSSSSQGIETFANNESLKPEKKRRCDDAAVTDVEQKVIDPTANDENVKSPMIEVVQGHIKPKRAPQTEGRKAKRKIAKKRKRAQKEREQGVKRLKLQPVVKPKEVKYCNYYLKGKCQQGDSCKFSHDTTPLTKSQPCKYFAINSCLKGDDCPFDHQLSKYACHNFTAKGMCIRGDRCKFSHKLPVPEDPNAASAARKPDTVPSSGKSNLVRQSLMSRTLRDSIDQCKSAVSASPRSAVPKQIPDGIRFLSFGKQKAEQQGKDMPPAPAHKNVSSLAQRLLTAAQSEKKNVMPSGPVNISAAARTANDGGLQDEVSEASKLLEEFLFCGIK